MFWRMRAGARLSTPKLLRRFGKNDKGATAVEFAMVSVPFLGLLFAIFETALVFFATESVESAVADAGRTIMTGNAYAGSYASANAFRDALICPKLPSFINCANVMVDVRTAGNSGSTSFGGAATADLSLNVTTTTSGGVTTSKYTISDQRYCIGSTSDIVTVRAIYPMPAYLSVLTATNITTVARSTDGLSNNTLDGKYAHLIDAVTVFRNEPFPSQTVNTASCTFP